MKLHRVNYLHNIFNVPWSLIHITEWINITETVLVEWYCFWDFFLLFAQRHPRRRRERRDYLKPARSFVQSPLQESDREREWIGQCIVFADRRITGAANSAELILEAVRWKTVLLSVYHRAAQTQNWKWNQEVCWVPEAPFDFKCKVHSPKKALFTHPHNVPHLYYFILYSKNK